MPSLISMIWIKANTTASFTNSLKGGNNRLKKFNGLLDPHIRQRLINIIKTH